MNCFAITPILFFFFFTTSVVSSSSSNQDHPLSFLGSKNNEEGTRRLADQPNTDWYARLVGSLISGAARASSTSHLPTTASPPPSLGASLSLNAATIPTTTSPPSSILSSSINPGNWFAARSHTPSPTSTSSNGGGRIASWMSSISQWMSSHTSPDKSPATVDAPPPSFTPVYGMANRYSPHTPYFNTLLPRHQASRACIALSFSSNKKHMYPGKADRAWECQSAALKRCYHDGQDICELGGIGVVESGSCVSVAKSKKGMLFAASTDIQDDEGQSTKHASISLCVASTGEECTLEYFDCPI